MKKILIISIAILLPFVNLYAREALTKGEKKILRTVKKLYKIDDAFFVKNSSSFRYIELLTRDNKKMVADSTGRLIVPSVYAEDAGYDNIKLEEDVFVAKRLLTRNSSLFHFYSREGVFLSEFYGGLIKESDGSSYKAFHDGKMGLLSRRGEVLIPLEYSLVETVSEGNYIVEQRQEGIMVKGVISVLGDKPNVPCQFNDVKLSERRDTWLVRVHRFDSWEAFDPQKDYVFDYRDEGERLFAQEKYDEARKFYALNGSEAPWSQFYIGTSYNQAACQCNGKIEEELEKLKHTDGENGYEIANSIRNNLSGLTENAGKALQALELYLESADQTFVMVAKEIRYELSEMLSHIPALQTQLELEVNSYEGRVARREIREKVQREQEQKEYEREIEQKRIEQEGQRIKMAREHEMNERLRLELQRRAEQRRREESQRKQQEQQTAQDKRGNQLDNKRGQTKGNNNR